jgi:predicted Zn-dependent protease
MSVATAAPQLPDLGTAAGGTLSLRDEQELGRQMMMEVRRQLPLVEDPEVVGYIRDLGQRLATHSDSPEMHFEFFVVNDPAINAFAMPGGYIGINVGLIQNARNESELAAVLAHEIAHVTQRHLARRLAAAERINLRTLALTLAGLLLSTQNGQAGSALATAGMAGSIQQQLNFSRAFEHEADNLGIRMLAAAGFDPHGMPSFFERLLQATRYYDRPPEYLSTHPANEARISESANRAESYRSEGIFESLSFRLMKHKLAVQGAQQPSLAIERLQVEAREARPSELAPVRYGLALALAADRRFDEAAKLLHDLIADGGEHPSYLLALARAEQGSGAHRSSLARFEQLLRLYPDHRPARLHYAEALIAAGDPQKAYHLLSRTLPSSDPQLYWILARAAAEAKLGAEPQLAMAEHYYLRGDLKAALLQLGQALDNRYASPHQLARAQARQEAVQQELEQALRER